MLLPNLALAWDAPGHRAITRVALERFCVGVTDPDASWFVREEWALRIADLANTPDRWRNSKLPWLSHINNPDHYLDVEDLADLDLSLETIEPLRHEFAAQLRLARDARPRAGRQPNPKFDAAKTDAYPGFLAHAICENYAKLQSSLKTLRILQKINDPARQHQLEAVQMATALSMGCLSHFVSDCAQPLHTTRHHHGWVGDNPEGFTTKREIHAQIDGDTIRKHELNEAAIRAWLSATPESAKAEAKPESTPSKKRGAKPDPMNPWPAVIAQIENSHAQVVPLYQLEKSGDLWRAPGAAFITERLADASAFLGDLYIAAWESAEPTEDDVATFIRYDGFAPAAGEASAPSPSPAPAGDSK